MFKIKAIILVAVAVFVGFVYYDSVVTKPAAINIPTEESNIPTITQNDISNGWYWGDENQKKPGTPSDWIYQTGGRSSCWHKPGVVCS